jgi:DNA adenine methylase
MIIPTFLKWAGGKRKILNEIDKHLPKKINRYFECFLGGGSVFFYIKQKYNPKYCMISDINKDLIETYKAVRDNPKELIKQIKHFKKKNSKEFYYSMREKFNKNKITGIKRCAVFIYMNKTCFNGLYRVNSKGEFNVPCGKYKNPEIFNEESILLASKLLKGVKIKCCDYELIKNKVRKNDFVYLDPCYDPLKKTSFANYTPRRFSDEDNDRLASFVWSLKKKGARILFSNNITKNVKRLYPKKDFDRIIVYCSRSINCNSQGRGLISEFLIKNYKEEQNAIYN